MRSRGWVYPAVGVVLAQGAPLGYLLLRSIVIGWPPTLGWVGWEIGSHKLTYGYLAASTTVVFLLLGRILGKKNEELRATSVTDPLTGLSNLRHFRVRLAEERERATRYRAPLSLLLVDVDGLKRINDERGHEAGDAAIRSVAASLRESCRSTDVVARIGGDEFAIVAPSTSAEVAVQLAERIRATLSESTQGGGDQVSVSIGVADLETAGEVSPDALLRMADRALYDAKAKGRDRVSLPPGARHSGAS